MDRNSNNFQERSKMTEQALKQIDKEISSLYEYCLQAGLTPEEIEKKASPLLTPIKVKKLKMKCLTTVKLMLLIAGIGLMLTSDPVYREVCMHGRYFLFKLLPWWDWTEIYSYPCLITNPFYQYHGISEADCQVCEDFIEIDKLNHTSAEEVTTLYLHNDLPVIVTDGMINWPVLDDSFTLINLTNGYLHDPLISSVDVCAFKTNLRVSNHRNLLKKLLSEAGIDKWYAHWENCHKPAEKFLRKFYSRPYFIPIMAEMTESNWLFMSSRYRGKYYKSVEPLGTTSLMWVAQIRGYQHIHLEPKSPCDRFCSALEDVLEEGDILLFITTMWKLSYLPGEGTDNLAIAAGGFLQ